VNYDNSLVMTITVTCNLWAPSSGDDLFTCGAIYLPPHRVAYLAFLKPDFEILVCSAHLRGNQKCQAKSGFFQSERLGSGKILHELHIRNKSLLTGVYDHARCSEYCKD